MKSKILLLFVILLVVLSTHIVAAQEPVTINILTMDQAAMQRL